MKKLMFIQILLILCIHGISQNDSSIAVRSVFERIGKSISEYSIDTTTPPDDKITKKIFELRKLRGGFNINEAIEFKLEEDRQKKEMPAEQLNLLADFFRTGNGKRLLDNAMVWIYRKHFSYNELKQLVKFYKTSAGQKLASDFPVIMMQSLAAAQMLKDGFMQQFATKEKSK